MKSAKCPDIIQERSVFWISFLVLLAVFFCCSNILYFISQASSPVIRSDAWYFLDTVIKKWAMAGVDFADFFIKRSLNDHAQPANKIALLLNYKIFSLDFRYEALIGFLGLWAIISMFTSIYFQRITRGCSNWYSAITFVIAILIISSLNTTEIYTWPLVTFGFVTFSLAFVTSLMTWKFLIYESTFGALAVSALSILLIGDTGAIILWLSLSITVAILFLRGDQSDRIQAIKWGIAITIFVLSYFIILNGKFLFAGTRHITPQVQSQMAWLDPLMYIEALRIVFSSSLVHVVHLINIGKYALPASWIVALIVFCLYVRYFVILFTSKVRPSREQFLITFILIYATVSVVAIIYGRVPVFGIDYLNQPRYVMTYQLIPFALMLDFAFLGTRKKIDFGVVRTCLFSTATLLFFVMQIAIIAEAYSSVTWVSRFNDKRANAIGSYLADPSLSAGNCTGYNPTLCKMSVEKRNELLSVLEEENLNVLNLEFQWRYRIFPFEENSLALQVQNWGPSTTSVTANPINIWIKPSRRIVDAKSQFVVMIDNHKIHPIVGEKVITFSVPPEVTTIAGKYTIKLIDNNYSTQVLPGFFEVTPN